jgi:hypothetical protein
MIVRIYGFALNQKELPPDIPASEILQYLRENSNLNSNETLRWIVTTTKIEDPKSKNMTDWFLGVLLKVRDSSRFTKVALWDGKLNITSEVLRDDESLLEANCFLLNPNKGTGIYSHYRGAGSLQYDFQKVFQKTLRKLQKILKEKFDEDVTKITQKTLRQRLDGRVLVDNILLLGNPKDVISRFKRINTASLKLTSEETVDTLFSGLKSKVTSRKLQVAFSNDAEPSQIAEVIHGAIHAAANHQISEASVQGIDEHDFHRTMSFDSNPLILSEFDYSKVMSDFNLQEDTAPANVLNLELSQQLIKLASTDQIWRLLNPEEKS